MSFFSKKKEKGISREQSLKGVPKLIETTKLDYDNEGSLTLIVKRKNWGPHQMIKAFSKIELPPKRIELDQIGKYVFLLIDGKSTIKQIIQSFRKEYDLHEKEAELSVVAFMNSLMERGAIVVEIPL